MQNIKKYRDFIKKEQFNIENKKLNKTIRIGYLLRTNIKSEENIIQVIFETI